MFVWMLIALMWLCLHDKGSLISPMISPMPTALIVCTAQYSEPIVSTSPPGVCVTTVEWGNYTLTAAWVLLVMKHMQVLYKRPPLPLSCTCSVYHTQSPVFCIVVTIP